MVTPRGRGEGDRGGKEEKRRRGEEERVRGKVERERGGGGGGEREGKGREETNEWWRNSHEYYYTVTPNVYKNTCIYERRYTSISENEIRADTKYTKHLQFKH